MARRFRRTGPTCRLPCSSRPDWFSSGDRPPEAIVEEARRSRMTTVRLLGFAPFREALPRQTGMSAPRKRSCLGLSPLAGLRAHPVRAVNRPLADRKSASRFNSPAPGAHPGPLSAHGFAAPFQRRRASDMHRPTSTCPTGGADTLACLLVGRRRPFSVFMRLTPRRSDGSEYPADQLPV
jgi:hypothetical protein